MVGSPAEEDLEFVSSEKAKKYLRTLPNCPQEDFGKLWPQANKQVCVLLY